MYYKVKIDAPELIPDKVTTDGCLSNWIDNTQPALYTRGEAIKKANMFGGRIIKVDKSSSVTEVSMMKLSANNLLFGIKTFLKFRDLFGSTDIENVNSFIYD